MKQLSVIIPIILMVLLVIGCGNASRLKNSDPTIAVKADDVEMNAAISNAQATLTNFIAALTLPQANQKYFLVKGRFTSGDVVEHIWVADVTYDGKIFRGVIANEPEDIKNLSFKQPVEVQPSEVSDWMFVQDGKLVGGYTTKVLRDRMSVQERRDEDAQVPYKFN